MSAPRGPSKAANLVVAPGKSNCHSTLLAHNLYDAAEVLRRYLEDYHKSELPEEDGILLGATDRLHKQADYGFPRAADRNRSVLRQIARDFGVDPQPRTMWLVEGPTELGFAMRFAELEGLDLTEVGIERLNLGGTGNLSSLIVRGVLEQRRREEVFVYVSVDEDQKGSHLPQLRQLAKDGLVNAGFRVWSPDFEDANFTRDELAGAATEYARSQGATGSILKSDIEREIERRSRGGEKCPVGKAIEALLKRLCVFDGKGEGWGRVLAEWTVEHACPEAKQDALKNRPIVSVFYYLMRGQISHYRFTVNNFVVNSDGNLVAKGTADNSQLAG